MHNLYFAVMPLKIYDKDQRYWNLNRHNNIKETVQSVVIL